MRRILPAKILGSLLVILGLTVIIAWYVGIPTLINIMPGQANMAFNTALCFFIAGITLAFSPKNASLQKYFYLSSGLALIILAGLTLSQYLFSYSAGLDQLFLNSWLPDNNPYPGRMSANSTLAFLLTGLVFILLPSSKNRTAIFTIHLATFCVCLLGISALIGRLLDLEFLYNWYTYSAMATHTAIGITLLGLGLGATWINNSNYNNFPEVSADRKILLLSAIILLSIALLAGLSGFVVSSKQDEKTLQLSLEELLQDKVNMLQDNINQAITEFKIIASDPELENLLETLKGTSKQNPRVAVNLLLKTTFSAMQVTNENGQLSYSTGEIAPASAISIPLNLAYNAQLLWHNGFVLQLSMPLKKPLLNQVLLLQWPLDSFNRIFYTRDKNKNKEVLLCYINKTQQVNCLPPQITNDNLSNALTSAESKKFVNFILENHPGLIKNIYSNQSNSILAYTPLGQQKLGLVVKTDLEEIYQPLRHELGLVIPILLFAVSLGAFLLYWRVSPLVRKLHESEAQSRAAFNYSAIGMALITPEGRWARVNPSLCRILGYKEAELLKMDFQSITYPGDLGISLEKSQQAVGGEIDHYELTKRYYHKNGNLIWALLNVSIIRDDFKKPLYFIAQIQDVTKQRALEEELNHQAHYDTLTGLANRALLEHDLNQIIAYAERNNKKFVIFFMDLDKFKQVNDSLGHDAGDRLLITVAERLRNNTRKSDIVARLGGDEFVLILPEVDDFETAASFAEKIRSVLLKPFTIKGHELFITTSIGISFYPVDGTNYSTLIKNADQALYRAKELGRNSYQFCASEISTQIKEKIAFEVALQQALTKDEFQIYYLPQIDPIYRKVTKIEALLRWQSKQYGIVSPQQIIPLAEETGLILPISAWVMKTACLQAKACQLSNSSHLGVSINISASQFLHSNLIDCIRESLDAAQLEPAYFTVEINETLLMQDPKITSYIIGLMKNLGIKITIDNFGTGYSSLSYLQDFLIDSIKIDRTIIEHIISDNKRAALAIAIIDLARNLGIRVIAEGIETKEQYDFLVKHGCDELQGYYIARPMITEDLLKFLENYQTKSTVTTH